MSNKYSVQLNLLSKMLDSYKSAILDRKIVDKKKSEVQKIKQIIEILDNELLVQFPEYSNIINPDILSVTQLREKVLEDEAIIITFIGMKHFFVWAFQKEGEISFSAIPLERNKIEDMVADLKKSLDQEGVEYLQDIKDFDLGYRLYSMLLKPVESGWKDAKNLVYITQNPLSQIPLSVLTTKKIAIDKSKAPLFSNHQKVPWLIRTHAVTRVPSAASFVVLRSMKKENDVRKTFAGFGDPWFSSIQSSETAQTTYQSQQRSTISLYRHTRPKTREMTSAKITDLPRLPETAEEVRSIASVLNANLDSDVFLGPQFSESQIKSMDLSNRKIIVFATHGLVAGDLDGLYQPALALSSPTITGKKDEDGLLKMSEIMDLNLNADWVVLSACNTAASSATENESLSGLGQAFFYAGTRALLVSMWPVETTSAKQLTTALFRNQKKDSSLSRSQALRKSILELIEGSGMVDPNTGKTIASYAHPLFWAPFIVVGEGGELN